LTWSRQQAASDHYEDADAPIASRLLAGVAQASLACDIWPKQQLMLRVVVRDCTLAAATSNSAARNMERVIADLHWTAGQCRCATRSGDDSVAFEPVHDTAPICCQLCLERARTHLPAGWGSTCGALRVSAWDVCATAATNLLPKTTPHQILVAVCTTGSTA
ncbi:hypothetical protein HaLaN_25923, partial [Haematococcus lacustris]